MITLSQYQTKAHNVHQLIHNSNCSCTLNTYNKLDVKFTSNITLNNSIKIKANEYMLGCPICHPTNSSTKTTITPKYIEIANIVHKDKGYTYILNTNTYNCPSHGIQTIDNLRDHLTNICPCTICDSLRLRDRYISQANKSNKGNTNIYFVSFTSKHSSESFFKVGLCFGSLEDRFKDWLVHYDITPIVFSTGNAADIYDLEQKIHQRIKLKQLSYIPMNAYNLGGSSECFLADQECINKLKSYIINKTT